MTLIAAAPAVATTTVAAAKIPVAVPTALGRGRHVQQTFKPAAPVMVRAATLINRIGRGDKRAARCTRVPFGTQLAPLARIHPADEQHHTRHPANGKDQEPQVFAHVVPFAAVRRDAGHGTSVTRAHLPLCPRLT